jgi:hypothetical protein
MYVGRYCQRKVCFFAHTQEQLWSKTKYKSHSTYRQRANGGHGSNGGEESASSPMPELAKKKNESNCFDGDPAIFEFFMLNGIFVSIFVSLF